MRRIVDAGKTALDGNTCLLGICRTSPGELQQARHILFVARLRFQLPNAHEVLQ
jgi:hypothetical protein